MAGTAKKTKPALWDKVKAKVTRGKKGGDAGQWSARKAQLAVAEYKKEGGGFWGGKSADNHLAQWSKDHSPKRRASNARTDGTKRRSDTKAETRAELYEKARHAGIAGRSRMTRDELQKALRRKRS